MPTTAAEADALYAQLQRRLVESGEWDRIRSILASKLNENGWFDDLRHRNKERAKDAVNIRFQQLYDEVAPGAEGTVPLAIKREIMTLVRQYLDKQFS